MQTNISRIKNDIITLSQFNSTPGNGVTRFSFSQEDKKAREFLVRRFKELNLQVITDPVGNIRARLAGTNPNAPVVMTGSHIDTVLNGGIFDGVVGVVGALEVVRVLVENKIQTKHPIEVVVFIEEEGSNFGSTMAGSKSMTGKYSLEDLKKIKTDSGLSMYEMAKNSYYEVDRLDEFVIKPGEIKAMIELHIEQGAVLDVENIPIGIVGAIAGIKVFQIKVAGVSNHAGATPMHLRKDPMPAAARMICELERLVKENYGFATVATVGKMLCYPNVSNIIPALVTFILDIRDVDPDGIDTCMQRFKGKLEDISRAYGVKTELNLMAETKAIKLSSMVIDVIETCAKDLGFSYKKMNSGAVHDSSLLAQLTEVGMIFVPSVEGRSHVAEEKTDFKDIKLGCDLLLKSILKLAN